MATSMNRSDTADLWAQVVRMASTKGNSSDLGSVDVSLISFWLGLPSAVRYLVVIMTILGAGWTARGTFSEWTGLAGRVSQIEVRLNQLEGNVTTTMMRMDATHLYLMCRAAEIDAGRTPQPCVHYVRPYPDIYEMLTRGNR
jgi:hypothetical protein